MSIFILSQTSWVLALLDAPRNLLKGPDCSMWPLPLPQQLFSLISFEDPASLVCADVPGKIRGSGYNAAQFYATQGP